MRRASLTPPEENNVTWEEYINAEPGEYPTLGRQLVYKESSKTFRATVAMVSTLICQKSFRHRKIFVIFLIRHSIQLEQRISAEC